MDLKKGDMWFPIEWRGCVAYVGQPNGSQRIQFCDLLGTQHGPFLEIVSVKMIDTNEYDKVLQISRHTKLRVQSSSNQWKSPVMFSTLNIDYFWLCLLDGSGNAFELSKQELFTSKSTDKPRVWLFSVQFGDFTPLISNNYKLSKQVQSCRQFKNEKKGRKIIWGLIEVLWSSGGQWRPLEARIKETSVCWKMIQQKWVEILVHTWLWKPW